VTHRDAVIAGDGAGPEVVAEARKAVDAIGLDIEWNDLPWAATSRRRRSAMRWPGACGVPWTR
jgi:isocitrate/isopropylmalate dehydrogenase